MGNVTMLPPTADQGVDFWDGFKAYYGAAGEVPILGFTLDTASIETELATLANIVGEYALPIDAGAAPEGTLDEFLTKLEEGGMQKVVDEANAQLNAFLSAK